MRRRTNKSATADASAGPQHEVVGADPLALRLIAGDERVLTEMLEIHCSRIRRWILGNYARRLRGCEIDDVIQEALLRLWNAREGIAPTCSSLPAYFRTIVLNVVRNRLKTSCHRQASTEISTAPAVLDGRASSCPEQNADAPGRAPTECERVVHEALRALSDLQRRILWADACDPAGKAVSQGLAREFGITPARLRAERSRGRRRLAELLSSPPPPGGGECESDGSEVMRAVVYNW